jgi:hypothetical protein
LQPRTASASGFELPAVEQIDVDRPEGPAPDCGDLEGDPPGSGTGERRDNGRAGDRDDKCEPARCAATRIEAMKADCRSGRECGREQTLEQRSQRSDRSIGRGDGTRPDRLEQATVQYSASKTGLGAQGVECSSSLPAPAIEQIPKGAGRVREQVLARTAHILPRAKLSVHSSVIGSHLKQ